MLYGVRSMHGSSRVGATALGLAPSEDGIYINLYAHWLGLPWIVIDPPWMSDEVSDQSLEFVVGPVVGNSKFSTELFVAVCCVDAALCQGFGPS